MIVAMSFYIYVSTAAKLQLFSQISKDAGNEVKLALIKRLTDALAPAVAEKKARRKKYTADDFAGIWDDEHYMAAEDINKAIRDARHVKSSREEIWDKL